jgi:hypothetical protein
MKKFLLAIVCLSLVAGSANAARTFRTLKKPVKGCPNIVSINSLRYILYKPSNLHGGRGMTFLVQNPQERPGKSRIEMRSLACKNVGFFGLFKTDYPYGARYYQQTGGSGNNTGVILRKLGGSKSILVEGRGKWIRIDNINFRQGSVVSP